MKPDISHSAKDKIIPLAMLERAPAAPRLAARFKIQQWDNRSGSKSWRVAGYKRDGTRIRENFKEEQVARCRQVELEAEYHSGPSETTMRATRLSHEQIQLAEVAIIKLGEDWMRLLDCVDHWKMSGKQKQSSESPRIDDAISKFKMWLDGETDANGNGHCTLRDESRRGLRVRLDIFSNSIRNLRVNQITPDAVEKFLGERNVSATTRDNYRRAVSRFFTWCIARPRRWTDSNPCREIRIERGEKAAPVILTNDQCKAMLRQAEREEIAAYVAVCLFGGLRPFEAARLSTKAINLADREIRLEGTQTKTGKPRLVAIDDTLHAWLKKYKGQAFFPPNWRRKFDRVKKAAGFDRSKKSQAAKNPWAPDAMRHTACSHYFRNTGSYGRTAEQFGNSEAIIKAHYQGRVSSKDTKAFYALRPAKKGGRK